MQRSFGQSILSLLRTQGMISFKSVTQRSFVDWQKHELVERIAKATEGESASSDGATKLYNGSLSDVPTSVTELNKRPVRFLLAVLRYHG